MPACSRFSVRVIFGNTLSKKGLQKVGGTSPFAGPMMMQAHPSRRIFNIPRRISLLIELVKEFDEYIGNSSCYVGNFRAEARLHFRRSNCLSKKGAITLGVSLIKSANPFMKF